MLHVRRFREMKITYSVFVWQSEWRLYVAVHYKSNVRTYRRDVSSCMSAGFICLSMEGNTTPARAMLSVRNTAIAAEKVSLNLMIVAAQCHWSYRTLCCFSMTKWRTSDLDKPAVWWPHWPEILHRIPTIQTTRTLRLWCVVRYSMEYSATCYVLTVQVMYKLWNTPCSVIEGDNIYIV
jgi:hypothetical protein